MLKNRIYAAKLHFFGANIGTRRKLQHHSASVSAGRIGSARTFHQFFLSRVLLKCNLHQQYTLFNKNVYRRSFCFNFTRTIGSDFELPSFRSHNFSSKSIMTCCKPRLRILFVIVYLLLILWLCIAYGRILSVLVLHKSRADQKHMSSNAMPKIIHQSWKSRDFIPQFLDDAVESWRKLNPGYEVRFWSDQEMDSFVRKEWPIYWELYRKFPRRIMQADYFRYLVVLKFGGVWSDIDTMCLKPVDTWNSSALIPVSSQTKKQSPLNAFIGVEFDASGVIIDWFSIKLQFVQWTFAFPREHPLLRYVVDKIYYKYINMTGYEISEYTVHRVTGPTIWTDAVLEFFSLSAGISNYHQFRYLKYPLVIGDVVVLPITAFSPNNVEMGGKTADHPDSLVEHLFYGSWKARRRVPAS